MIIIKMTKTKPLKLLEEKNLMDRENIKKFKK